MPSPLQDKMLHPDFAEMLRTLCEHEVDFLVVGAHAMAARGIVRATGDIEIWVRPVIENAQKVWAALAEFGAGLDDLTPDDLSVPSRAHLVQNKRATGRPRDIGDAIWLESLGSEHD